ncbi:MAG TPA: ATP-binding protein, partial [Gemmataceae bacterium]|nr:ATP-binding protein [Gemmataceae bacterium]
MVLRRTFFKRSKYPLLQPLLEKHLGGSCHNAHTITHKLKAPERVGLQLELDQWHAGDADHARLVGYSGGRHVFSAGLAEMVTSDDMVLAPVQREQLPQSTDGSLDCVKQGIYLLRQESAPIVLHVRSEESYRHPPTLEIMARQRDVAQAALSGLLTRARSRGVYKGKCISLEMEGDYGNRDVGIRFHRLPATSRDAIVLPDAVLQVVERNVLGLLKHGDTLRQSGRGTRHGLLFHGRPGTGKTLMVRYLAQACPDHTVILLTGRQLGLIRESCQIARLLAPAMVVLEDVDLIAEDRAQNKCTTLLHELLDEMDGIGAKTDCIFLLTT